MLGLGLDSGEVYQSFIVWGNCLSFRVRVRDRGRVRVIVSCFWVRINCFSFQVSVSVRDRGRVRFIVSCFRVKVNCMSFAHSGF